MLRTPSRDLALLIGSAPISGADHRAGNLIPLRPLPTLRLAVCGAIASALAFGTVAYGALAYANRPLPAPTMRAHMPAAYTAPAPRPVRVVYP